MTEQATMERPILFSGEMVRALLRKQDPKTQTRRVIDPQPEGGFEDGQEWFEWCHPRSGCIAAESRQELIERYCPYGRVGDRLWVREAWRTNRIYDDAAPRDVPAGSSLWWEADGSSFRMLGAKPGKLRPSIFMMPWMSRIKLELTRVRIERLHHIGEVDGKAEGVEPKRVLSVDRGGEPYLSYSQAYADLWDLLNAKRGYGWERNPWVWVLEFRRIEP